jgi:hypothetical protein
MTGGGIFPHAGRLRNVRRARLSPLRTLCRTPVRRMWWHAWSAAARRQRRRLFRGQAGRGRDRSSPQPQAIVPPIGPQARKCAPAFAEGTRSRGRRPSGPHLPHFATTRAAPGPGADIYHGGARTAVNQSRDGPTAARRRRHERLHSERQGRGSSPFGRSGSPMVKPKRAAEGTRTLDLLHGKQTL